MQENMSTQSKISETTTLALKQSKNKRNKKQFTYVDLFSGIGGFRIAIDPLGGRSVGYSEIDQRAIETYKQNFNDPDEHNLGDITKLEALPKCDLVVGGVPCQSWSVAGKMRGFDDPRGRLWFNTLDHVSKSKPKVFVFENVKGLSDPRNKDNLELILESFTKAGYFVDYQVLNTFDFGYPQNRSRIFIVGFREDYKKQFDMFSFPKKNRAQLSLATYLDGVEIRDWQKRKFDEVELFNGSVPMSRNQFQKPDELNDFFVFCDTRNGHTTIHSWDIKNTTRAQKSICLTILKNRRKKRFGDNDGNPIPFDSLVALNPLTSVADINALVQMKILKVNPKGEIELVNSKNSAGVDGIYRVYLPNSEIFSTLTATGTKDYIATEYVTGSSVDEFKSNFIENIFKKGKIRQITSREALSIQGFPENFKLHQKDIYARKQIGNSVAPPVVNALLRQILRTGVFD